MEILLCIWLISAIPAAIAAMFMLYHQGQQYVLKAEFLPVAFLSFTPIINTLYIVYVFGYSMYRFVKNGGPQRFLKQIKNYFITCFKQLKWYV